MKPKIAIKTIGQATITPRQKWLCRRCGREFKLPLIPETCETLYSICFTCYSVSCSSAPLVGDELSR